MTYLLNIQRLRLLILCLFLLPLTVTGAQETIPLPKSPVSRELLEAVKLKATNGGDGDKLGRSVAISADGLTVLGGADQDEVLSNNTGYATVFMYDEGQWTQQQLNDCNGLAGDEFGASAALSADGNTAIIGAIKDDASGNNNGSACVFVRDVNNNWTEQAKLLPDDLGGETSAQFGRSAALSADGNMAIVGAWNADNGVNGVDAGEVYVFTRTGITWTQVQFFMPGDPITTDYHFGVSVALSANDSTLIVGANQLDGGNGAAYVYTNNAGVWNFQQKLTASDGANNDEFGKSVVLSADGNVALIGGNSDDAGATADAGSAYIFTRSGTVWSQQQKLLAGDPGTLEQFGFAVDLNADGTQALIGARWDKTTGDRGGAAYIFRLNNGTWVQTRKLLASSGSSGDWFGAAVALSPDATRAVVGAVGGEGKRGVIYLFTDLPFTSCDEILGATTSECEALVDLYNSSTGAGWTDNTHWLTTNAVCTWYGVTCRDNQISGLNLFSNGLVGTIPASLSNLIALEYLNLADNTLTGGIPSGLGSITTLRELALGDNPLGGSLPNSLGNLVNLTKLNLYHNDLIGAVPASLWELNHLLELDVTDNQLTGSLPAAIDQLASIVDLRLGGNQFSGTLPAELGNLIALQRLYLNGNQFAGEIPANLQNLGDLNAGDFGYNSLTASDAGVIALLNTVDPDWDNTQTIPPTSLAHEVMTDDENVTGFRLSWTPVVYTGNGGHYAIDCSGVADVNMNTVDKTVAEVEFTGVPGGNYSCEVSTFTPPHQHNQSGLTSTAVTVNFSQPNLADPAPPNDLFANPLVFDGYPRQNYSFNIEAATIATDPLPPVGDPNCQIELPEGSEAIHYEIPGDAPGFGGVGDQGIVMQAGGPGWFTRDAGTAADTAIIVYEVNPDQSLGAIVACADDNAPGEISVSSLNFDLDTNKNYRAVVWNEGAAPVGAVIELGLASFDLGSPANNTVLSALPNQFTWNAFSGAEAYYFEVAETDLANKITLAERTPEADEDELFCTATQCTLFVLPGSALANFMTGGNYLWSVAARMSDDMMRESNQIFRFVLSSEISTSTPPPPTDTVTPTPTDVPGELLVNGGFEIDSDDDKVPDGWTLKNPSSDKLKCNKPDKVVAHTGNCAFQFKGNPGELSSLEQVMDGVAVSSGEALEVRLWFNGKDIPAGTKFTVKVKYASADPAKIKLAITTGTTASYTELVSEALTLSGEVNELKAKLSYRGTAGKLVLDDVSLSKVTTSRLIPLK